MAYTTRFGKLVRLHDSYTRSGKRIKEAPRYDEPKLKADKGEMNGSCNRTACQKPGADWFNHSTRRYYCAHCAYELNTDRFNRKDAMELYGHDLCTPGLHVEADYA